MRIKQGVLQRVSGIRFQTQQAAAAVQGAAGPQPQPVPIQPPGLARDAFGRPSVLSSASPWPTKPASPPSLAGALGHNTNNKAENPIPSLLPKGKGAFFLCEREDLLREICPTATHPQTSQTAGPSLGTPIPFQELPGSSPSRRTIFPLNRPPTSAAPAQSTPHVPKPSSSGQAAESSSADRSKSPWTPAKADKARLAQAIMQSLGRPSIGSQLPAPAHPPSSSSQGPVTEDSAASKRKRTPSVTESPMQKKQKVGMEVEEIATDGAFELAVWQQQNSDRVSVAGSEAGSPQKPGPSAVPDGPIRMQGGVESNPAQAGSGVDGFNGAPTLVEGTFARPAPFPSIGDYLGIHISQPEADAEPRDSSVEPNEQPAYPSAREPESSPPPLGSVGTAPPTSRTASPPALVEPLPPADPGIPMAELGPSTTKTPLFLPSPTSDHGHAVGGGNVSDLEEEPDPAEVFASAFSANADLVTSPRSIPTRAKGKARMIVSDSEDEGSRFLLKQPVAQRKQRVVDADVDVESERAKKKNRGRKSIQRDESDVEILEESLTSKRRASRKVNQPSVNRAYVLVPRMPKWVKKLREQEKEQGLHKTTRKARKASTPETVPESVDELAVDDGAW